MTDTEKLKELLTAATPRPWLYRAKSNSFHELPPEGTAYSYGHSIMDDENCLSDADVELVLAAVNALPALLEEVERLRAALQLIATQGPYYGPDGTWRTWRHWSRIAAHAIAPNGATHD